MTTKSNARFRGLVSARADATPKELIEGIAKGFEEFKAAHNKELADIKANKADVLNTEKVDRINGEITNLQKALDETNASMAALKVGSIGSQENAYVKAHSAAFDRFFRKGIDADLRDLEVKAILRSNSDPDGGYLVPQQTEAGINELLRTTSIVRSLATVMTISAATYKKIINMQGSTSGWVGESDARTTTTTPTLSALEFPVFEIYANPGTTQTNLDDSQVDIAAWLAAEVQGEFADEEGAAFVNGTGVNKPRGILGYTNIANASYAWGKVGYIASGAAADFATANPGDKLIDTVHALRPGYRQNATWLMNDLTAAKIRKFKDGMGNYLWQPSVVLGTPSSLLGYPVATDDNMPDVGANAYSVAFADFKKTYLVLDRQGIRVLRDPYTSKPNVLFYTTKRVGGGIQNFESIKLLKIAAS